MTHDAVAVAARAAAQGLSPQYGPKLVADVEASLYEFSVAGRRQQYVDPLELASLIVSAASFAWQIYDSRRSKGEKPTAPVLARDVRVKQREITQLDGTQEKVIEIVASEIVRIEGEQH